MNLLPCPMSHQLSIMLMHSFDSSTSFSIECLHVTAANGILLVLDEGEISCTLSWQRHRYCTHIDLVVCRTYRVLHRS